MKKFLFWAATIIVILASILIGLFIWITAPREQRILGTAESNDGKYVINVMYTDYGGSYSEEGGGVHLEVYIMKKGIFFSKKKEIIPDENFPCTSSFNVCTKQVISSNTAGCESKPYRAANGETRCVTKKLQNFEIRGDHFIWYGKEYELP